MPQGSGRLHGSRAKRTPSICPDVFGRNYLMGMSLFVVRVQPVSATPLVVYRLAFGSPRSFADVD